MKHKCFAAALILCLVLGLMNTGGALAENYTVYVTANTLKVYARVSTSSSVLGVMSYGESMTCLATNSGWAAVRNSKGSIGYCKIGGLSIKNPNTYSVKAYVTASNTPVYRKPDTSSSVMMYLKKNSSYTAVAVTQDGDWVRLQNGKYYGYVQTKYLSKSADSGTGNLNTTVYISANTLKAYDRPSTSGKSLGTMSYGESMTLLATSGDWARIRNSGGAVGYCKTSGLTTENPNNLSQKVYAASSGVKVYKKPTTSAGVMMVLSKGAGYTCVAMTSDGAWLRLKNGNSYGYVQSKYFSTSVPGEENTETTVYVSDITLKVYKSADTSSSVLGTMSFGESMMLLQVDDGWAQVRNNSGSVGYCGYGGLTTVNPNTKNQAVYAAKDGTRLFSKAMESSTVLSTVQRNTSLMAVALSEDGEWARILLSSGYAYALTEELSLEKQYENDSQIQDVSATTVYVKDTNLSCYASNSTSAKALGVMSFGESMTLTGKGGGWARVVNASGSVGYCLESGLTTANPNTYNVTLYSQKSGVKVYQKALTSSTAIYTLSLNSKVTGVCQSAEKDWVRLYNGSAYGYVQAAYLATSPVQTENSKISNVVTLAKSLQGIRYKYAAQSPSDGFDCSGFTYYVYKNAAGVSLKRTAKTQGYDDSYKKITSRSDLKVGDLVFFNTVSDDDDLCDHVGIYLGSNQFIHASSAKGEVTISSLGTSSSDYYYRTYSWGRRILS